MNLLGDIIPVLLKVYLIYTSLLQLQSKKDPKMAEQMERTVSTRAPTRIGCYVIGKTIGKGNFAVVKCAIHTSANVKVSFVILQT